LIEPSEWIDPAGWLNRNGCAIVPPLLIVGGAKLEIGKPPRKRRVVKKRIVISELNIVSQPHSPAMYAAAFHTLAAEKTRVQYHLHRRIEVGTCVPLNDSRLPDALTGSLFIFSRVNFDDPWLNMAANAEATEKDLEQLSIPPHLAPELRSVRYILDINRHRFFFESVSADNKSVSAKSLAKSLNLMFQADSIKAMFEEINAFVVSDKEAVEKILHLPKLRRLEIRLFRPNPDDDSFEHDVLKNMNSEHVGVQEITLIKAPGALSIVPSAMTEKLARLAARFGFVEGRGRDENGPIKADTEQHPVEYPIAYSETEDALDKTVGFIAEKNEADA
jgi:hypothetical protein